MHSGLPGLELVWKLPTSHAVNLPFGADVALLNWVLAASSPDASVLVGPSCSKMLPPGASPALCFSSFCSHTPHTNLAHVAFSLAGI